jgi:oxygen-independent coproporphyrinogen III oxidase
MNLGALLRRYDRPGPRYTSYPTAVEFNGQFDEAAYRGLLQAAASAASEPLSLYLHIPFCQSKCAYCGCMVIATGRREVAARYLTYLEREIEMVAAALGSRRRLAQHHWGGGTPTYLTCDQMVRLHDAVTRHFTLEPEAEQAVEIDPRVTSRAQLVTLRGLGFSRLSMGVQDLDPDVQEAIGRRQSLEMTRRLHDEAREVGFESINVDLVYGLPRQRLDTFKRTLEAIVDLAPDRIAVYGYAHVPWLRPNQRRIAVVDLPDPAMRLELFGEAVAAFLGSGYQPIGMDHFARASDELAKAARAGRLHRNFMGYTTQPATDMIGVGLSAIGDIRGAFAQNAKKLSEYYAAVDAGRFPIERGYILTADDHIRRRVITDLMCNFRVDRADIESRFGIDFDDYFKVDLAALAAPDGAAADGLVDITADGLDVTAAGRLFVRNICMTFDRYLQAHASTPTFSRTV